mmetsp:Transcript_9555/g.17930  ORF Transcript_9555/g.17930 Transcript_9555/m.17930 type:complete len:218 (+) Transcript_9555:60-713(+)|eukprot:CAMPEP_0197472400 /NCGR_PEP_ID=MMETSP1309-20131121/3592_1 /TAXON_ID=464262 /ORGANISM="Genus nov. species nov., Strain RCC998" /LENGTH=217 /DNA_ID=CAMNT_0043010915 /DNA_START=51 /DNA_END=704 /DNA_ORIENTATION=+
MQGLSLHDAARQGDLIRVRQVLAEQEDEAGGEGGKPANERDKHARTPLHLASWAGHLEVVEELLKANGVEVGASARDDTSALHFACQKGHTLIAKRLLGKGANVNAKNRKGVTPLMMAAQKGELSLVELLLKKRADPLVRSKKGDCALDVAQTSVYDVIKEASNKAKEEKRKGNNVSAEGDAQEDTKRKEIEVEKNSSEQKKPKRPKMVHLSHLEED